MSVWNNVTQSFEYLTTITSDGTPTNDPQWNGDLKDYVYKTPTGCVITLQAQDVGTGDGDVQIYVVDRNNNQLFFDYNWWTWNTFNLTITVS